MHLWPPATDDPDGISGNCCRVGLALSAGSAFLAVGGLLSSGATALLIAGLGAAAVAGATAVYGLAGRRGPGAAGTGENAPKQEPRAGTADLEQLKDSFLSAISHELRTPLTNICAYAELLLHLVPGDQAEWPRFLRIVQDESQRLSRLVDSVMEYVRMESGELEIVEEEVDLREVARRAVDSCAERAGSRDIRVSMHVEPGLPPMRSDAARLTQALVHLLDNALKFTPAGGRVELRMFAAEGRAVLTVDDSGPGIRPEYRELAFEKFNQLRDHLTAKPEGTGLGLSTARLLVTRLGGSIACEDSPLGGARFRCDLPLQRPSADDVPSPPLGEQPRHQTPTI